LLDGHDDQVQAYLLLTGYDHWYVLYENKLSQEWIEVKVERDPIKIAKLAQILDQLSEALYDQQLPPILKECRNGQGKTFHGCPYSNICHATKDWPNSP
jgi:hypothetical protein